MKHTHLVLITLITCLLLVGGVQASTQIWSGSVTNPATGIANFTDVQSTAQVVKPVVQGVTSVDNIDQSLDSGWAAANTYALTNAVNEGATHIQTFTPTKKLITNISINCVATGTAVTWTLVVHDASNNVLSSNTITPVAGVNSISVPALWTSGNLHFHVYASATTGTPTLKSASANDLETGSYIEYYAKNTEDVQVDVNGVRLSLISNGTVIGDATGLLSGAIVDTDKRFYNYSWNVNDADNSHLYGDIYSATYGGGSAPSVINGWAKQAPYQGRPYLQGGSDGTQTNIQWKINTMLPVQTCSFESIAAQNSGSWIGNLSYSSDGVTWKPLHTYQYAFWTTNKSTITDLAGNTTFYAMMAANTVLFPSSLSVNCTLNTTGLPTQSVIVGTNDYNISSNGRADSASLDPSMLANVWLMGQGSVNNPPTSIFTTNVTSGVNNLALYLNDTSTESPTMWNTSWGESPIPSWTNQTSFPATNITHVYSTAGSYTITHYATNAYGTGSATTAITVYGFANSQFSVFNVAGTAPHTTYLYDTSTNTTGGTNSWYWMLGDGNVSTAQNLYYTWNMTGTFPVNHSFSNGLSTSWKNESAYITVGTPVPPVVAPVASFYGGPEIGNPPLQVFLTDVSTNTPTSWNWSLGNGLFSESQNPTIWYNESGFYTVSLTATNPAGSNITSKSNFIMVY